VCLFIGTQMRLECIKDPRFLRIHALFGPGANDPRSPRRISRDPQSLQQISQVHDLLKKRVLKFGGSGSSGSAISLDPGPYGIHNLHKSRLWHYDRPDLLRSVKPTRLEIQLWDYLNFGNNNFPNNIVENQYILRQLHFSLLEKTLILLETLNWA